MLEGMQIGAPIMENSMQETELTSNPAIPLLGIYPVKKHNLKYPGEALSVPPAGGAPTRRQRRRGVGVQGCDWKPGSTPCPAGRSPHEARIATLKPARRWRLQPPTCPSTSRRAPRACHIHVCAMGCACALSLFSGV